MPTGMSPLQCCAIREIYELRASSGPKEAMKGAFKDYLNSRDYYLKRNYSIENVKLQKYCPSMLLFTGQIEFANDKARSQDESNYKYTWRDYGTEFATFLRENKLGEVMDGIESWNMKNHPDHKVKVWLWKPDVERVEAWLAREWPFVKEPEVKKEVHDSGEEDEDEDDGTFDYDPNCTCYACEDETKRRAARASNQYAATTTKVKIPSITITARTYDYLGTISST